MKEKTIYDLELNETLKVDGNCYYQRVPGGWVLTSYEYDYDNSPIMNSTFIPYNDEFEADH